MSFPQAAKNNLVVAFSLANFFTDDQGQYLSLHAQMAAMQQMQKLLGWQSHHLYETAVTGTCAAQRSLALYLKLESSIDLFMRYVTPPACLLQTNLAYLDENVQNFIYQQLKGNFVRGVLAESKPPAAAAVKHAVRAVIKEKVLGYAKKLPGQSTEEWQIFVAEINVGIEILSAQYRDIVLTLHEQFFYFRRGQIAFTRNYLERCRFLAKLEEWLQQVPQAQQCPRMTALQLTQLCQMLEKLKRNYNEFDVQALFLQLTALQQRKPNQEQYKTIAMFLIRLKPQYDAYRSGQDSLNEKAQLQQFMAFWPKPQLASWASVVARAEAKQTWTALRSKHRIAQEEKMASETTLKHKLPSFNLPG